MSVKIKTLGEMAHLMALRRHAAKSWVLCHGVFDGIHPGHLRHLEWAKQQGDILVVSVTPDHAVQKGAGRPHFNHEYRLQLVASLNCVDYTVLNDSVDAVGVLSELQPDVYVKGPDIQREPTEAFAREAAYVTTYGGVVRFSPTDVEMHGQSPAEVSYATAELGRKQAPLSPETGPRLEARAADSADNGGSGADASL